MPNELIPELRFPEFGDEWEEKRLGKLFSNSKTKGNDSIPVYSVSQDKGLVPRESLDRNIQKDAESGDNLKVQPNDLVYNTMRMWQGAVGFAVEECMVSPAYVVLSPQKKVDPQFFLYFFERLRTRYLFTIHSHGLTLDRLRLYYKDFSGIKVKVPSYVEQKKITNFLTAVDEKIKALTKKKTLLEEYKKGVMQRLFSQEVRFKDEQGQDFPDWEEKTLGEVLTIGSGRDYKHLNSGQVPVFGTGGYMLSVDKYLYDGETVCIGRKGTIDSPMYFSGKIWTVDTLFYTHSFKNVLPRFMYYTFLKINWKEYNEASGIPSLSKSTIEKILINIPNPSEQQKIADFLTALDEKINKATQQIETAQAFKKGLLQKMFV